MKKTPTEFWLTQQNAGGKMVTADVWYSDPIKFHFWKPEWEVYHVRVVKKRRRIRATTVKQEKD